MRHAQRKSRGLVWLREVSIKPEALGEVLEPVAQFPSPVNVAFYAAHPECDGAPPPLRRSEMLHPPGYVHAQSVYDHVEHRGGRAGACIRQISPRRIIAVPRPLPLGSTRWYIPDTVSASRS